MDNNKNTLSIAALVLGIVGIIFDFIYAIVGLVAGIVGIVLALKARKTENAVGMATGGLICSIIAVALAAILVFVAICTVGLFATALYGMM